MKKEPAKKEPIKKQVQQQKKQTKKAPKVEEKPKVVEVKKVKEEIKPKREVPEPYIIREIEQEEPQFSISQSGIEKQEQAQVILKKEPQLGQVTVKYSHYKDQFGITDGHLKESDVDEKYCLSFVFKGNYEIRLRKEKEKVYMERTPNGWQGCENQEVYVIEVEEDPEEVAKEVHKPYVAYKPDEECDLKKKNKRLDNITGELKNMSLEELKEKGQKYQDLIEARDIEDILYK